LRILSEQQEALLKEERRLLDSLRLALVRFDAAPEDVETLGDSIEQLDELFLAGRWSASSTPARAPSSMPCSGRKLLKEGVTPTTTQINILRYGEQTDRQVLDEHLHMSCTLPVDWLSEISIVDTPGTNAIIRALTRPSPPSFVPRSDLVLFITSADRPFTESERAFLETNP
jgi:hypothetical protein